MNTFLKNHPFAVEAYFKSSVVLTYAVPKEQLEKLIPECLTLDTFDNTWGFIAMAMVHTKHLRPKRVPKFLGNDFFLIGYRIFVKYTTSSGKRLRGLYIIKSETNQKKMQFLGNIFTHYNYTTTDIKQTITEKDTKITSIKSDFNIIVKQTNTASTLPKHSPFSNWKEARRFAGPLPFTFTYNKTKKEVLIIEGVRKNWKPVPLTVVEECVSFIDQLNLKDTVLASAFIVKDIPYYWQKGKTDLWKP